VGRGTWGLKEWYPGRSFKKEKGDNGGKEEPEGESEAKVGTAVVPPVAPRMAPRVVPGFVPPRPPLPTPERKIFGAKKSDASGS
jgi:hypothetical protein